MSLPNGPKSPAIWQMLQWLATPVAFMRACRDRYGDCFTVTFGKRCPPTVFCSHPNDLQLLLSGDDAGLFEAPGHLDDELEPLLGTQSLMALSGERHRRMRQLLMPPFHGERMRSYGQLIGDITAEVMAQQGVGKAFEARKAVQRLSLRVILRAVFGVKEGARYERLEGLLGRMLDALSDPLAASPLFMPALRKDFGPWSPWGRFLRLRRQVDPLLYQEIAERRTHPDASRPDILTLLLAARDQAGEALTDGELRDELMTLLAAGHETTATALTWALFWIHKLPAVRQRLLEELQALNGPLDPAAVARLPFLNAVCSETLRIYPVGMVTFTRVTKSAVELAGCRLEPGTRVVGCIYLAHQREEVYPNADQFRPERFLERRYSPFEYLPFGGGVRRCIGMAFAQFEVKVALSGILSGFDLALADDGRSVRPVRRGVTAGPSPFRMVVKACRSTPPRPIRQASSLNG